MNQLFSKSLVIAVFFFSLLSSCCNYSEQETVIYQTVSKTLKLNKPLLENDTVSFESEGVKISVCKYPVIVDGVNYYRIMINSSSQDFYTYKDDVFPDLQAYGEHSLLLRRGSYEKLVGKPEKFMMIANLTWVTSYLKTPNRYIYDEYPFEEIRLFNCTETKGEIMGEIKLGIDIPKYSKLKFKIWENGNVAVLNSVEFES